MCWTATGPWPAPILATSSHAAALVRRVAAVALGLVLILLGLFDVHVQVGAIVVGAFLLGGGSIATIVEMVRGPRPPSTSD